MVFVLLNKNGWKDGDTEKDALHALVGGIMSELTGNGFLAGASASTVNEMVQKKLSEQFEGEPDKHQWASAIIGGVVSQLVAENTQAGASTAASGTNNNYLTHEQQKKYEEELAAIDKDDMLTPEQKAKAKAKVDFKYSVISVLQNREWYEKNKDKLQLTGKVGDLNEYEIFKEVVGVDKSGNDVELRADTKDWMIGYSRDLVEAVANIKPGDRIKFSDGSIYYVQPNGELYKEDSIGALMPYKEISLEDHNVISKRESLFDKDTVISDDHHEKAGQYVYDTVGNVLEMSAGLKMSYELMKDPKIYSFTFIGGITAAGVLLVHSNNDLIANVSGAKHDLIDNDSQKYNFVKNNLGSNFYNKLDITAKVISIYGDASSFAIAIKKGRLDNINWDKVITDDFERTRVKEMLNDIGILMDVKTIEELKQNHETDN